MTRDGVVRPLLDHSKFDRKLLIGWKAVQRRGEVWSERCGIDPVDLVALATIRDGGSSDAQSLCGGKLDTLGSSPSTMQIPSDAEEPWPGRTSGVIGVKTLTSDPRLGERLRCQLPRHEIAHLLGEPRMDAPGVPIVDARESIRIAPSLTHQLGIGFRGSLPHTYTCRNALAA